MLGKCLGWIIELVTFLSLHVLAGAVVFLPIGLIGSLLTGDWLGLLYLSLFGSVVGVLLGTGRLVVSYFDNDTVTVQTATVDTVDRAEAKQEATQTMTATSNLEPVFRADQLPPATGWKNMYDYARHIRETIRVLSEQGFDGRFQALEFIEYCRQQGDGFIRGIFHCTSFKESYVTWFLANQEHAEIQLPDHSVRNLLWQINEFKLQSENAVSWFEMEHKRRDAPVANCHLLTTIWNDEGKLLLGSSAIPIGVDEPLEKLISNLHATHPDLGKES